MWAYIGWPANLGGRRDIPSTALFHHSVLSRMRLAADPKNYRPNPYLPNNSLWVASPTKGTAQNTSAPDATGEPEQIQTYLSKLAAALTPTNGVNHASETQRLVEPALHFLHADGLTTGSVEIKGETVVVGAEKWDRIYRVVQGSS